MTPATQRLRYGRESIEDDPFIVAASTQSLNTIDRKKEKQAPCVNYGYFSEGKLVSLFSECTAFDIRYRLIACTQRCLSLSQSKEANEEDLQISTEGTALYWCQLIHSIT